jgi:hypothetical protein
MPLDSGSYQGQAGLSGGAAKERLAEGQSDNTKTLVLRSLDDSSPNPAARGIAWPGRKEWFPGRTKGMLLGAKVDRGVLNGQCFYFGRT